MFETMFFVRLSTEDHKHSASATLTVDLPFPPVPGLKFGHSVWSEERLATSVMYHLNMKCFHVSFAESDLPSPGVFQQMMQMYKEHGWEVVGG